MKGMRYKYCTLLSLILASFSANSANFYLSVNGDDINGDGSISAPWKTLHKARDEVRKIQRPLQENVSVILRDGTYELASTLHLSEADSGSESFKVVYKAENPGQVIISGGSIVKGWSDSDGDGIWQASVPASSDSRQLYVNNQRAVRARSTNGNGWYRNSTGYSAPSEASSWTNQEDIELVWGFLWKMNRGGIKSINDGQATMDDDFFLGSAIGPFDIASRGIRPSWVENAFELLDEEGEWYLNKHNNTVYYKPKSDEAMIGDRAVEVVLPRLEKLIEGKKSHHIEFDGLQFSYSTWLRPNNSAGYLAVQAGVTMGDVNYINIEDAFDGIVETPGNVHFTLSSNITFRNTHFTHLGGAGLGLGRGTKNSTVFNSSFDDISASAIVIGTAQDHHIHGDKWRVKDNLVDNNYITNVGVEYQDNPAVISLYADRSVIIDNTIENVPYSAISIGWGWGRYDVDEWAFTNDNTGKAYNVPTQLKENLVIGNKINGLMLVRHDGGGIYNLSSNMNSRITDNVITGGHILNGAVYLDNGSRGFHVYNNVSYANTGPRTDLHINVAGSPSMYHNIPTTGELANDWSGRSHSYNPAFKDVVKSAGQKQSPRIRSVKDIVASLPDVPELPKGTTPPEQGLLVGKAAFASDHSAEALNAIDGNPNSFWSPGKDVSSAWWGVDLGRKLKLDHVSFAFGHVVNDEVNYTRDNITFQIQASNDGNIWTDLAFHSGGYNGSETPQTTVHTSAQAINDLIISSKEAYQFIRINIVNSNNQHIGLLRVKVTGEIAPDGVNVAIDGKAAQSSTAWSGEASRAIDGNTDGNFFANSVTHTSEQQDAYWELDLGESTTINSIRIWNRTDCCSERLNNFHVFVSEAPFTGTTVKESQSQVGVIDHHVKESVGKKVDIDVESTGRYVRVQLDSSFQVLSLSEVEVYAPASR